MHDHEYYQELMSRLLDEGVTAEEEKDLKEHLRACPECAALFSALSAVTVSLREDEMAEPPAELSQGVMARIAAEKAAGPRVIHVQRPELEAERPRRKKRGWTGIAAAACLVVVIGSGAFWFFSGRDKSAPTEGAADSAVYARAAAQEAPAAEEAEEPEAAPAAGGTDESALSGAMEEEAADMPMTVSAEDSAAVPMPEPTATPVPGPLTVRDVARQKVGEVPADNIPAFAALLEGGTVLGGAQKDWEFLFTVEYSDTEVSFATNEEESRLVWWDPNTPITAASGSLDDLRDLVDLADSPVPQ